MSGRNSISHFLTKKAAEIAADVETAQEFISDVQTIQEFLKNRISNIKLTKKQEEKRKRYQFAYAQASSGRFTDEEVRNLIMSEYGGTVERAYEDMRCMRELYTIVESPDKKFELMLALQTNKRLMIKCEEMGKMDVVAILERNKVNILKQLETLEQNPSENFKGHVFMPVFAPQLINDESIDMKEVMKAINEKRNVKLDLSKLNVLDIPHEDVSNADSLQHPPAP